MALKEKITVDMQDAMRSKDSEKLNAIRLLQSSIKQKEVDDRVEIDDTMILNIIEKMLKQRRDSIEAFKKANRDDLVAKEEFEVQLLQTYMPEPLSSEDVEKEIDSAIKAADAKSMKDMGTVMSAVKLKISGNLSDTDTRADLCDWILETLDPQRPTQEWAESLQRLDQ